MVLWSLAIALTALACASLYYAAVGRRVNAGGQVATDALADHHRLQLQELDADLRDGRLGAAEALAAKRELAREVLRQQAEAPGGDRAPGLSRSAIAVSLVGTAVVALGTYALLGNPALPSAPLAARADIPVLDLTLPEAVARIEAQLGLTPGDVRGWMVIAPAYVQLQRYPDAINAYRRVLELAGPSADVETGLAEARLLAAGGVADAETLALLESAADRDPAHAKSRLYLAAEKMRVGDYGAASARWRELLSLARGDEPWLGAAREGLLAAEEALALEPGR